MLYSTLFLSLYSKVLDDDRTKNGVDEDAMKQAIRNMRDAYNGNPAKLLKETYDTADYNELAHRCAYLYKYAPMHTALVYEAMSRALTENPHTYRMFQGLLCSKKLFKICSLGSGPGTDVIGVLAALFDKFSFFHISAQLVDIMPEWERTFASVVSKLRLEPDTYGILSKNFSVGYFDWSFIGADLQEKISEDLQVVIESSNLITLVKFVSASACNKTSEMIENIFRIMKPGAMVLFIDNAGGGFQELITAAARKHNLVPIFGPLNHEPYVNETFSSRQFGSKSCHKTTVAVQLLRKLTREQFSTGMNLSPQRYPAETNYHPQGHLLQHRYPPQIIQRRNESLIPSPFHLNNPHARHFAPLRNRNSFDFRGFNVLPPGYFPFFT